VAAYYGCPSLNLSKEVSDRIAAGQFSWEKDFRDVHPSAFGQRVYANSMIRMLDAAFRTEAAPKPHPLPEKPLDDLSFFRGRHGKLEDAKLTRGFALERNWSSKTGQEQRAGYGNCPAITADTAGAELSYTFEGTAFGLFLAAGKDTGIIEFSTDGAPFKPFDTWSPNSGDLNLPWPVILENGLKTGQHTITIRTTDQAKDRQALHIIHVLLN
jgi:sialidase-1